MRHVQSLYRNNESPLFAKFKYELKVLNDDIRRSRIKSPTYHRVPSTSKTIPIKHGASDSLLRAGSRGAKRFV